MKKFGDMIFFKDFYKINSIKITFKKNVILSLLLLQQKQKMKTTSALIVFAFILFFVNIQAQVTDKNGRTYKTVKIGKQEWMAENLNVNAYRNGDSITQVQDPRKWSNLSTGAWCYYDNKPENGSKQGKLYNWFAVNDSRGLAPAGWHIPSDEEWTQLINFLGGEEAGGATLRNQKNWKMEGKDQNNIGFEGLPSGSRDIDGTFSGIGNNCEWWSATESNTYNSWFRFLNNYFSNAGKGNYDKLSGFSVRCIKD